MKNAEKMPSLKENVKALANRWFITAFSGMAQGLFVTLIAGTILAMIAGWIGVDQFDSAKNLIKEGNFIGNTLLFIANIAKTLMGANVKLNVSSPTLPSVSTQQNTPSINLTIGDIQLYGVQDTDTLSRAIINELPNKVIQSIYRR